MRILLFTDQYLPGYKAGGPIRTISNLVKLLDGEVEFAIVTSDRDLGDHAPYPELERDVWTSGAHPRIRYCSPRGKSIRSLRQLVAGTRYDLVYLNSLFSPFTRRVLALRRARALPPAPLVLAPRGELSPGAMRKGLAKKRAYLRIARTLRLYGGVTWQASSPHEAGQIRALAGPGARVLLAPNPSVAQPAPATARAPKQPGRARIAYLARIARNKNLLGGLEMLRLVPGAVEFDIYGIAEDQEYWARCQRAIAAMPERVRCVYRGPVPPDRVEETLAGHDFFFLPTLGENFGHVIVEALRAGCPVVISDQTPWRGLEPARAGWDLPLDDMGAFAAVLRRCVEMDDPEYREWVAGARAFVERAAPSGEAVEAHRVLFRTALRGAS